MLAGKSAYSQFCPVRYGVPAWSKNYQHKECRVYSESRVKDAALFLKAVVSNQLARWAPSAYMTLTGETGRGEGSNVPARAAKYFSECVDDYRRQLALGTDEFDAFLQGKHVLEYGPGNTLGVALLLYAHGAESVHCVDRFELVKASPPDVEVYRLLVDALPEPQRHRARTAFVEYGDPASGFAPTAIRYLVRADGVSGAERVYDLVISRAVLEHVNNLQRTFHDISKALKPDGVSVHQVDLRSHGLDRYQAFDFLTWPSYLYEPMFSAKGCPNRYRANTYRDIVDSCGLAIEKMEATEKLDAAKVALIFPHLCASLRGVSEEDLSWMGFWMVLRHKPAAA